MSSLSKVGSIKFTFVLFLFAVLLSAYLVPFRALAHGGAETEAPKTAPVKSDTPIASAERNLQTDAGQFNVRLERVPTDPRTGETSQIALRLAEKVEGGFGSNAPVAIDDAVVTAEVTTADGKNVAGKLAMKFEKGAYRGTYTFANAGDFKINFNVTTSDNRSFTVDFPVTVTKAPLNWTFWLGLAFLGLLTVAAILAVYMMTRGRGEHSRTNARALAPVAVAAVMIFALGTAVLAYFSPPRQQRSIAEVETLGTGSGASDNAPANALKASLIVPKESQILFGIKTAPVEIRQITAGLKTSGTVRARPDAQAVVVPPVAGRLVLRKGLSIGSAVGRGEEIGTVMQVLDVSGQVGLEQQRLEVQAQQRDVEARRLELRNTVLALQGQQAQQRAASSQARIRLAQARRELTRSANLVESGAVPKRRLEEAQTAVNVAEQEAAAAEKQVVLLDNQIRQAQAGQSVFRAPTVNAPTRSFPLTAPVTGIVNEIKATSGQLVETATQILTISNLSTVLIQAQVFEKDLPTVRESTRASFTSAALNGEVYTIGTKDGDGRLISVGQTVDPQSRTVDVTYEVINPFQRLRDGMFVEMTIDTSGGTQVLAVPKSSVITEQGQSFVFVYDGGESFSKTPVALGAEGSDYYEVKSGIEAGERVVTEGIYQLRSTQPSA